MLYMLVLPRLNIERIYKNFHVPTTPVDCGQHCAVHNPTGKPFCCDICQAVPVAYHPEWDYLKPNTTLWQPWRGDECPHEPTDPAPLQADLPDGMLFVACKGPVFCEREYRTVSCRQFPFFPYITSDFRFIGMAYDWDFESRCWILSNLDQVTSAYRQEFIETFDQLFNLWPEEMENYAMLSEDMREHFLTVKRRIPLLHRKGNFALVSPGNERCQTVQPNQFKKYGFYR